MYSLRDGGQDKRTRGSNTPHQSRQPKPQRKLCHGFQGSISISGSFGCWTSHRCPSPTGPCPRRPTRRRWVADESWKTWSQSVCPGSPKQRGLPRMTIIWHSNWLAVASQAPEWVQLQGLRTEDWLAIIDTWKGVARKAGCSCPPSVRRHTII